jgi:hypothetical protein
MRKIPSAPPPSYALLPPTVCVHADRAESRVRRRALPSVECLPDAVGFLSVFATETETTTGQLIPAIDLTQACC